MVSSARVTAGAPAGSSQRSARIPLRRIFRRCAKARAEVAPWGAHLIVLSSLLLAPVVHAAEAGQDPLGWLERMARAAHSLTYEGTFVYRFDGHMQSMRIAHSAGPRVERERLVALSGPPLEVVREGNRIACIVPKNESVLVGKTRGAGPLPLNLPEQLPSLGEHYQVRFGDTERIAEHDARKVSIRPLDKFRYGHNYWIGNDTGLLLQAQLLDSDGRVVEEVLFTSLEVRDELPLDRLMPENSEGLDWRERSGARDREVQQSRWRVSDLPPGFEMTAHRRGAKDGVEHLVFSDGLASVSVFVEPHDSGSFAERSQRGALHVETRVVDAYRVTVMGEVPRATVQRIAAGTTYGTEPAR